MNTQQACKHLFILSAIALSTGCGAAVVEPSENISEGEAAMIQQAIENGQVLPSKHSDGVVRLYIWHAIDGYWKDACSGQVIAKNAILTAAHCFEQMGHFDGDNVAIRAYHQKHQDGSWELITGGGGTTYDWTTISIPDSYGGNSDWGSDIAVAVSRNDLTNVVPSDAAVLDNERNRTGLGVWAYGYGYVSDTDRSGRLRRGKFDDLDYLGSVITANTTASDAHVCSGDSGGPLKWLSTGDSYDGLSVGVTAGGNGADECKENRAYFARVSHHVSWIETKLTTDCIDRSFTRGVVKGRYCWGDTN